MAGIPTYTESPISPAKATAITPRTTSLPRSPYTSATTTASSATSSYAPPQPSSALPTPTQTSATRTSQTPPPPQPGALPTPSLPSSRTPSPRREIPPPPKVGEKPLPASYYSPIPTPTYYTQSQPFPPQTSMPPLQEPRSAGIPPGSTTSTAPNGLLSPQTALSYTSPAQTPTTATSLSSRRSLEHPPGYVQNPYATEMTPEQRFGTQHSPGSPSLGYNGNGSIKSPGIMGGLAGLGSPSGLGGILNGDGKAEGESVWGVLGGWASAVGRKVGEVEGEVWRRINGH